MAPVFGMLRSMSEIIRACMDIKKRVLDNIFDDDDDLGDDDNDGCCELDIVAVQPELKRRRYSTRVELCSNVNGLPLYMCGRNKECLDRMWEWLCEDKISRIGIYGMAGIGKTALAMQLHERVRGCEFVGSIAWVSVGMHFTIPRLQNEIAGKLGFGPLDDSDEVRRAAKLHALLSRVGKCLIILDELWDNFRLELVGVPENCKIVLTSRSFDVCRKMNCHKVVHVEPLLPREAWQLFCHAAGDDAMVSSEVRGIAERVCDECCGVPLAIITMVESMRGKVDAYSWKKAVEGITRFSGVPRNLKNMFAIFKLSYSSLRDVKLQRCFLYCALYPEDYAITREELIRLWIGDTLIEDLPSIQPQYDKGHSVINKLLKSSLLENIEDERKIKVHDLIHDMAIAITKGSFMAKASKQLNDMSMEWKWRKDLKAVSLMKNFISNIPSDVSPDCPSLSTLLMHHNPIQAIPDSFFEHMHALHVLNLSYTPIKKLPTSMSKLEVLRFLDLSFCQNLTQFPPLVSLRNLRFLDLSHTVVAEVPCSLECLVLLTELDLSCIPTLGYFPKGVLPSLCKLRRLSCNFVGIISEIQSLKSLEILHATFPSLSDLSGYVLSQHWCSLESFHLQVGHGMQANRECSRRVSLFDCSLTAEEGECIILPDNIQEIYIDDCRDFSCLSDVIYPFAACDCRKCRNLLDTEYVGATTCKGEDRFIKQGTEAFSKLEICSIRRCRSVLKLFRPDWIQNLQSLVLLEIQDCVDLKELIAEEVEEGRYSGINVAAIVLPQLQRLVLSSLPQLYSIYQDLIVCASLKRLTFMDCPKLNRLPFFLDADNLHKCTLSTLEYIEGQKEWWDLLIWDQPQSEELLKPLFRCKSPKLAHQWSDPCLRN